MRDALWKHRAASVCFNLDRYGVEDHNQKATMVDLDQLTEETVSVITEAQGEGLDQEEAIDAFTAAILPAVVKLARIGNPTA